MSAEPPSVKRPQAVSGYITKQASSFPWNWKRRWACYDAKTMTLSYFEGKDDEAPKGRLKLLTMRAFAAHGSGEVPLGIIFEGVDPDDGATKKMKATVESALDHSRWMRLIKPAVPQGSDRADAMFNSILHAVLPIVRNAIGAKLVDENIKGGLALKGTPYFLKMVRRDGGARPKEDPLMPGEVLSALTVHTTRVHVQKEVEPPVSASAWEEGKDDIRSLHLDVGALVKIEFGRDTIDFALEGREWWSPNLSVAIEEMHAEVDLHVVWDVTKMEVAVGFKSAPAVDWDIDLKLGFVDLPSPIEDGLLPWVVERVLSGFTEENPIRIPLKPKADDASAAAPAAAPAPA